MEAQSLPFLISDDDNQRLKTCEEFQLIRRSVANQQGHHFCNHHESLHSEDRDSWLLHQDIIHALISPVLRIYRQASQLANSILCPSGAADLELAFRDEARGAFSWLQCLFSDEEELCPVTGCPACNVTHVLHSEPTLRLILVASHVPEYLDTKNSHQPELSMFTFWLRSLRAALDTDPLWGPGYWDEIERKALRLVKGIKHLLRQCRDLEDTIASNNSGVGEKMDSSNDLKMTLLNRSRTTNVCHLPLARQQLVLIAEEEAWMRSIILTCWRTLLAEAAFERQHRPHTQRSVITVRARSSTV
ncbi:hypothetical protein MMC16_002887 [Acarospora aff. strigata]|nr:hypothetical protein [Acarospora aff. strigata]